MTSNCHQPRGRQTCRLEEDLTEEPMNRYIHPIPCCCGCCPSFWNVGTPELDRILEALARQNQLLMELLGAVNGLNAAVLSIGNRI